MIDKLSNHQKTSSDIYGKRIINHTLCDFFYCINSVHVTVCGIIDQNIDLSVSLYHSRINLIYGILINRIIEAAEILEKEGIQAKVLKLNQISPLKFDDLQPYFENPGTLLVLEDSFGAGCVGQRVAAILAENGNAPKQLILRNLGRQFAPEGSVEELEQKFRLDAVSVAEVVREAVRHGK